MKTPTFDLWLKLALLPALTPALCKSLHALLGAQAPECWDALLRSESGFVPALQTSILDVLHGSLAASHQQQLAACLQWALQPYCELLTLACPHYPPLLREIPEPPALLFVRGRSEVLQLPQIAIVGSRRPTADGLRHARRFALELAASGYRICSGLALGIDAAAHEGALSAGTDTIAVLGAGPDRIHPRRHEALAQRIAAQGAVVSEFLPGTRPHPGNFPQRNRIISGLSHGVLVIEAAEQSGSLITARLAAEQGREVFALPGSINNPMARGCHRLIRQGAKLVDRVEDMLEEVPAMVAWERVQQQGLQPAAEACDTAALDQQSRDLLGHIAYDGILPDALALRCGLSMAQLQARLVLLELQGLIRLEAGGYARTATRAGNLDPA